MSTDNIKTAHNHNTDQTSNNRPTVLTPTITASMNYQCVITYRYIITLNKH